MNVSKTPWCSTASDMDEESSPTFLCLSQLCQSRFAAVINTRNNLEIPIFSCFSYQSWTVLKTWLCSTWKVFNVSVQKHWRWIKGIIPLTLILDCEMQSEDTAHQCCIFGGLRKGVSMFGFTLTVWWNRFSVPPSKLANESSRVYAPTGSSASPHTHVCTKDTVLSALVLCGVHTGESSSHTTEKLEEKKKKHVFCHTGGKPVEPEQHAVDTSRFWSSQRGRPH